MFQEHLPRWLVLPAGDAGRQLLHERVVDAARLRHLSRVAGLVAASPSWYRRQLHQTERTEDELSEKAGAG